MLESKELNMNVAEKKLQREKFYSELNNYIIEVLFNNGGELMATTLKKFLDDDKCSHAKAIHSEYDKLGNAWHFTGFSDRFENNLLGAARLGWFKLERRVHGKSKRIWLVETK